MECELAYRICVQLLQSRPYCLDQSEACGGSQIGSHKARLGASASVEQLDAHLAIGQGRGVPVFQQWLSFDSDCLTKLGRLLLEDVPAFVLGSGGAIGVPAGNTQVW